MQNKSPCVLGTPLPDEYIYEVWKDIKYPEKLRIFKSPLAANHYVNNQPGGFDCHYIKKVVIE